MTPRQRINPPAKLDDPFIDYTIYACPIRGRQCVALEDRHGGWWTAPDWEKFGSFGWIEQGDSHQFSLFRSPSREARTWENTEGEAIKLVTELMERFNGGHVIYTRQMGESDRSYWDEDLLLPIRDAYWNQYDRIPEDDVPMFTTTKHVLCPLHMNDLTNLDDRYATARERWARVFNKRYPAPPDARHDSYYISLRSAAARHAAACRAKRSRHKHRQFSLTFTND